jgi:ribosomal protein L29
MLHSTSARSDFEVLTKEALIERHGSSSGRSTEGDGYLEKEINEARQTLFDTKTEMNMEQSKSKLGVMKAVKRRRLRKEVARLQTELLDLEMEKESGFRNNTKG